MNYLPFVIDRTHCVDSCGNIVVLDTTLFESCILSRVALYIYSQLTVGSSSNMLTVDGVKYLELIPDQTAYRIHPYMYTTSSVAFQRNSSDSELMSPPIYFDEEFPLKCIISVSPQGAVKLIISDTDDRNDDTFELANVKRVRDGVELLGS